MSGTTVYYTEEVFRDWEKVIVKTKYLGFYTIKEIRSLMLKNKIKEIKATRYVEKPNYFYKRNIKRKASIEFIQTYELINNKPLKTNTIRKNVTDQYD